MSSYPVRENPWGLTGGQCAALDAMVQHGCHKRAASALGLSEKTTSWQMHCAMARMRVRVPLLAVLEWDRWSRDGLRELGLRGPST